MCFSKGTIEAARQLATSQMGRLNDAIFDVTVYVFFELLAISPLLESSGLTVEEVVADVKVKTKAQVLNLPSHTLQLYYEACGGAMPDTDRQCEEMNAALVLVERSIQAALNSGSSA